MVRNTYDIPELNEQKKQLLDELEKITDKAIDRGYMPERNERVPVDFDGKIYPLEAIVKRHLQAKYEKNGWSVSFTVGCDHHKLEHSFYDRMWLERTLNQPVETTTA
ncbi:hypothetical protein HYT23_01220 [Candidatus Pacearchaeota archaeon]|nr:hypothetical protein [Candidatus Pacearchaeota archaeon]